MMTRSQTRIAQLEEEKDFYKDLHEGFAYKLFLKEKELQARIVELEKENEKLKIHNERLSKQTGDLWELASFCDGDGFVIQYHQIEQLIEMRGEEYVKEVFAEDYEDYKEVEEDEDEDE